MGYFQEVIPLLEEVIVAATQTMLELLKPEPSQYTGVVPPVDSIATQTAPIPFPPATSSAWPQMAATGSQSALHAPMMLETGAVTVKF